MNVNEMLKKLEENFGTAESENVSENNYSFKNKNTQMQKDILFLERMNRTERRLYIKDKLGYDR